MEDLNKITSTRVGDSIHFFVNGKEDNGTVVKMDTSYVTVVKDDGKFQDIHINDTFFIKDILVNKSWNDMNMEERTVELHKVHAYSPRFLSKSWQELPRELKDVIKIRDSKGKLLPNENDNSLASQQSKEGAASSARYTGVGEGAGKKVGNNQITHTEGSEIGDINFYKPNKDKTPPSGNVQDKYPSGGIIVDEPNKKITTNRNNLESGHTRQIRNRLNAGKIPSKNSNRVNPDTGAEPKRGGWSSDPKYKSNVEQGHLGGAGRSGQVVETNTNFDAEDDYEGQTEDVKVEQFKHEKLKPKTTNKTMQDQLWEDWLNKESMGGGDSSPAQTSITTGTTGMYNAVYGKDGRIKGQEKDKDEEETEKDKESKEKERKG